MRSLAASVPMALLLPGWQSQTCKQLGLTNSRTWRNLFGKVPARSLSGKLGLQLRTATAAIPGRTCIGQALGSLSSISTRLEQFQGATRSFGKPRLVCSVATEVAAEKEEEVKAPPKEIFLKDYKAPDYSFDSVNLSFSLWEEHTIVVSTIKVSPLQPGAGALLVLQGEELELLSLKINGKDVPDSEYKRTEGTLDLLNPPKENFELQIETKIYPQNNTSLEGLYKSSTQMFCTQCEPEGFRKMTFYQDRPDVMSTFVTRVEADKGAYPVLLSNGNLLKEGDLEGGRHFAVWEDPWRKPSYLFALVAGQLVSLEDTFTTSSGRQVALRIWVQEPDLGKTKHAMDSLKAAMRWDEQVFGLEYDLDLFNIVAVPDFNMGAMENKSLNVFNSRLVLATPETATDGDYTAIEAVVAHEYFHNWTGNRVTCRDWFQLSLKEGLTVYRDQEFSSDMNSRGVERISDVLMLRSRQFPEDAGPMAHPVRPQSYIKMDNFYTVTVYEKGAEVVRMYESLLGKEGFRKGMDLYFQRHDGQAVTCDDFLAAMRDANGADLRGFSSWLSQAGTPVVTVKTTYDERSHSFTIHCRQETPSTPGQPSKEPVLLPLAVGLLGPSGADLPLNLVYDGEALRSVKNADGSSKNTAVLPFRKAEQEFTFLDVTERPVPSLLRNFSAPVRLVTDYSQEDLLFLLANDSDEYNRWEAGQTIARNMILALIEAQQQGRDLEVAPSFLEAMRSVLSNKDLDKAFVARVLSLPGESELADLMTVADPDAIHRVHRFVTRQLAAFLKPLLLETIERCRSTGAYTPDHPSKAKRSLKNSCLVFLASLNEAETTEVAVKEFKAAGNMTEQLGALAAIAQNPGQERDTAMEEFYQQWKDNNLVMNKWLALQAAAPIPNNVAICRELLGHPAFNIKEPNKVYALVGGFCSCAVNFHASDGSGYQFLGDMVQQLDKLNPQVAARMVSSFTRWRKYDEARQNLAKTQLERIVATEGLSANTYEIVSKCLGA